MNLLPWAAAATPSPSDTGMVDESLVTPGPWGFAVIAVLAVIVILLVIDMLRRIRRARYRSEVREQLDAEELAAAQGDRAVLESDADDQDVDPDHNR
ncbi:MAG: hypothetical protein NT132_07085 [Microbacterium sp.]|uniref:hypothetical protein n=1 Tax=Microbacterium sp. TaxID=51671 RepID=UPI0026086237|nr:hypothetical protein [Microbacterium sp.]MCX6502154.1 hypothetical protein [Microbacterium sp.]